jgi:hypothetical protein
MAKANSNNNKLLENGLPVLGGDHDTFDYSNRFVLKDLKQIWS